MRTGNPNDETCRLLLEASSVPGSLVCATVLLSVIIVTTAVGIFILDTGEFTLASAAEISQLTTESHGAAYITVKHGIVSAVVVTTLVTLVYVISTVGVLLTVPFGGAVLVALLSIISIALLMFLISG